MSKKILQAALEIALIRERFAEEEILGAVQLLEEHGNSSVLLAYLAGRSRATTLTESPSRRRKTVDKQRSQAVIDLEKTDPAKYKILDEFDALLRQGKVLPAIADIRRMGERLSKDFASRNSRREMISTLMGVLADCPLNEIEMAVKEAVSVSGLKESEYQELADFIIRGKSG
jgi:hypothetical protein